MRESSKMGLTRVSRIGAALWLIIKRLFADLEFVEGSWPGAFEMRF